MSLKKILIYKIADKAPQFLKKFFSPLLYISILLILISQNLSPVYSQESGLNENWGTRPYEEEVKAFWIIRQNILKKNHQLMSSYMQTKNSLDAYMSEWGESKKEEAEQWFKTSSYYPTKLAGNLEYLEEEYDKNKKLWDELAGDIKKLPREQWGSYIKFLREEQELFNLRVTYYNNKLQAIKAHSSDWLEEFMIDCLEDYYIVLEEVISSLPDELLKCFKGALTSALKNLTQQSIAGELDSLNENMVSVGDSVVSCIKDIPLALICNALNAALKRQFIKEMNENGIDELVAAYWWDSVVQGNEKKPILAESIDTLMSAEFWTKELTGDKIKQWAAETAIPEIKKEAQRIYQQEYKQRILDKGLEGTDAAKQFREQYKKFINKVAEDKTENHIYNEYFKAASFAYDYLKTGYTALISGRGRFDNIAEKLYAKYRHIKQCLQKRGEEPTPQKMLSIFEMPEEEFNKWFKENCAGDKKGDLDEALNKCENIYNSMTAINEEALGLIPQGDNACNSVEEKITGAWEFLDQQNSPDADILSETVFTSLYSSLQEKLKSLSALVKESNDAYVAAGLYKRYCENAALDACQNAQKLKNTMNSMSSRIIDVNPNAAQQERPSDVMSSANKANSETEKNGNLALNNIKKSEDIESAALKLKDEIVEAVKTYREKAAKGREEIIKAQNDARKSLSDARGFLSALNAVIRSLQGKETILTQKWNDVRQILKPWATDEKAKGIFDRIRTIRDNLSSLINNLADCAKSADGNIKKLDKAMAEKANGIDERAFQENQDKLSNLYKLAEGYYNDIWKNNEKAKGEKSAVESAIDNAKLCLDKAREFLDKINEAQTSRDNEGVTNRPDGEGVAGHEGGFSTAGGETTAGGSKEDCNRLHDEVVKELFGGRNYDRAEALLARSKHCDWYDTEAGYLYYVKVCIPLTKAYEAAIAKKDWALAKSLHRKDPKCWIEGEDFDENSIGRDEDSGFSTSGGETDTTDTRQPEPQKESCSELQKKFQAALDSGDLNWARSILNDARNCGFYDKASQALQSALDARVEAQRPARPPQPERSPQPERNPQPDRNPQPEGSQPPPIDVNEANEYDFPGNYNLSDPIRTIQQYHGTMILYQNGQFNSEEWLYNSKITGPGIWKYDRSTLTMTIHFNPNGGGGFFSGPVTGNTNDFTISGYWSNKKPGQLRLTRK